MFSEPGLQKTPQKLKKYYIYNLADEILIV